VRHLLGLRISFEGHATRNLDRLERARSRYRRPGNALRNFHESRPKIAGFHRLILSGLALSGAFSVWRAGHNSATKSLRGVREVTRMTANLPAVKSVQILVDGKQLETLAGHVDLRRPLERNLAWVE